MLKPFGIAPEVIRLNGWQHAPRLYAELSSKMPGNDTFRRNKPLSKCNSVTNAMDVEQVDGFRSVTEGRCYTLKKCKKSNNDGICYAVTR